MARQGILGGQKMNKTDFRVWLASHCFLVIGLFWWCLDNKALMFFNICLAVGLAIGAMILVGERGAEDGK